MADVYDQLLDEQTRAPLPAAQPPVPQGDDVYDKILDQSLAAQNQAISTSLEQAIKVLPDKAAGAQELAKATGLPLDAVERNFDEVSRYAKIKELQSFLASSPILARQMADPEFAKLAQRDVQNLGALEKVFEESRNLGRVIGSSAYGMSAGAVGAARAPVELLAPLLDPLAGTLLPENPLRRVEQGLANYQGSIQAQADRLMPQAESIVGAGVYSGVASLTRNLLAMPLAFLPGGQTAALTAMTAPVFGEEYGKARTKGVDPWMSVGYGASQAAIEWWTENWALSKLVGDLKVGSPFYKLLLNQLVREIPGEQAATILQDLNEWALLNPEKTARDYLEERPSAAAQTLIATIIGVGGQTTVMKGINTVANKAERDAQQAELAASALAKIIQAARASELLKHNPESFEQFVEQASEGGPIESVYIDAQVLMQSGMGEALAQISPSVAEQLPQAAATGGVVQIPVAEYAAKIAPTEFADALLDELRVDPQGFSRNEALAYMQSQTQELQQQLEQRLAEQEGYDEFKASQQRVKDLVLGELNALGRFTEAKNELDAALIAARTAVRAAQLGITPEQMFERQRLRVTDRIPQQKQQLDTVEQGGEIPEGAYVSWGLEADPVIDDEGFATTGDEYVLIEKVFVPEEHRQKGVARRILRNALREIKEAHPDKAIKLAALPDPGTVSMDDLIAFYESEGFEVTGTAGDAVVMEFDGEIRGQQYNQRKAAPRGVYVPSERTIALLQDANLSTFLHEAGHYFFESDIQLAGEIAQEAKLFGYDNLTEGEKQILADVSALFTWHGIQGDIHTQLAAWAAMDFEERRAYHERTAESFERYLLEGKAPSIELQSYFQTFRAWLLNVYRSLKDFLARHPEAGKLNDEVRGVFDRMLATNEQIQLAEMGRSMMPLFRTAEEAQAVGMTPEEFEAYQRLGTQATADAIQDLQARGLRDMQWLAGARGREIKKLQKKAAALRRQVRARVRTEVLQNPVYKAWSFLTGRLTEEDRAAIPKPEKVSTNEVDPTRDSLLVAIAKLGGLRKGDVVKQWGVDPKESIDSGIFGKPVLRVNGGRTIDDMRQVLAELGYLDNDHTDPNWNPNELEERFDAELRGDSQYSQWADIGVLDPRAAEEPGADLTNVGAGRLSLPALRSMGYTEDQIAVLKSRKMTATEGLHPDMVADLPGVNMDSGDALVQALLAADPMNDVIEALTDARMLELYGDLATPEAIEQAADRAIHNDVRARMVATEISALNNAAGIRSRKRGEGGLIYQAAKQFADVMVARSRIRDIKPVVYANAAARAGRAADTAMRGKDLATAAAEKRNQIVNTLAARAAHNARDEMAKALRYLTKFNSDNVRKRVDVEYLDQIDKLLERFDLRQGVSGRALDKRASLLEWIAEQENAGMQPDIPEYLVKEANRTHYKDMTLEEFRGLVDTVRQIEHLGRLKKTLLTAKGKRELDAIVDEIRARIEESSGGRVVDNERRDTLTSKITQFGRWAEAVHRKAASVVREMDGFQDGGPMWEYFIRTMNEAGDREATMRADAAKRLYAIAKPILKGEPMGGKGRYFPTLGRSLNRGERIAMALNWGNEGNRQRLLDGRGWTQTQVQPVLESLTAQEWQFVQGVWDFFESYRPQIAEKERRVNGKEPDWIEPTPFAIRTADGTEVNVRGGYYPIKYDPMQSGKAGEFAEAEEAKSMMRAAYTASTTRRSFTKTRAEEVKGRPLLLTFDGIWQGANEVIHDLAWHEWLIDANRLIKRLDSAIRTHYGAQYVDVLRSAVKDTARGDTPATNILERSLNHVRTGSTVVGLAWNFTTAMLQPLGLSQSAVRLGSRWLAAGMKQFFGSPQHMLEKAAEVREKSEMMRNRALTMNREINDVRNRLEARSEARQRMEASFFYLIQKMQAMVDYPTWLGAYEKAIAEGNNEDRAIALADQTVIDTQGGGQIKDLAQAQRGHPAMKLFTNFYSYFNVLANLAFEQTRKRVQAKEYVGLMGDYVLLMIIPAVMDTVIRAALRGENDEEEFLKSALGNIITYPLGMFIGLRELGGAVQHMVGDDNPFSYGGPAGLRLFAEFDKLGKQIGQGDLDMALFKAGNNVGGILFHYPSGVINRFIDGIVALIEGKTNNPLAPIGGYAR